MPGCNIRSRSHRYHLYYSLAVRTSFCTICTSVCLSASCLLFLPVVCRPTCLLLMCYLFLLEGSVVFTPYLPWRRLPRVNPSLLPVTRQTRVQHRVLMLTLHRFSDKFTSIEDTIYQQWHTVDYGCANVLRNTDASLGTLWGRLSYTQTGHFIFLTANAFCQHFILYDLKVPHLSYLYITADPDNMFYF